MKGKIWAGVFGAGVIGSLFVFSLVQVSLPYTAYIPGTCPMTYFKFLNPPNCPMPRGFYLSWDDLLYIFVSVAIIGLFGWQVAGLGFSKGFARAMIIAGALGTLFLFFDVVVFTWILGVFFHIPSALSPFPWWGERLSANSCLVPMSDYNLNHPNCWFINYGDLFIATLGVGFAGFIMQGKLADSLQSFE